MYINNCFNVHTTIFVVIKISKKNSRKNINIKMKICVFIILIIVKSKLYHSLPRHNILTSIYFKYCINLIC